MCTSESSIRRIKMVFDIRVIWIKNLANVIKIICSSNLASFVSLSPSLSLTAPQNIFSRCSESAPLHYLRVGASQLREWDRRRWLNGAQYKLWFACACRITYTNRLLFRFRFIEYWWKWWADTTTIHIGNDTWLCVNRHRRRIGRVSRARSACGRLVCVFTCFCLCMFANATFLCSHKKNLLITIFMIVAERQRNSSSTSNRNNNNND